MNARAKAYNAPQIPYESVTNFIKLPTGMYLGESMGVARNSKDGVKGTPTFFINGVKLDNEKEMTLARLDAVIAAAKAGKDPAEADKAFKGPK